MKPERRSKSTERGRENAGLGRVRSLQFAAWAVAVAVGSHRQQIQSDGVPLDSSAGARASVGLVGGGRVQAGFSWPSKSTYAQRLHLTSLRRLLQVA